MRKRLIVSLAGSVVLLAITLSQTPTSQASSVVHYRRGYSLQAGWLCYGWADGIYHCTQRYHADSRGILVVEHTPFVPQPSNLALITLQGHSAPSGNGTPPAPSAPNPVNTVGQPCHDRVVFPASIHQWSAPSGCYGRIYYPNPANYVNRPSYGWCNWWPEVLHPTLTGYAALHQPNHSTPRAGAVVFFAPFVQGASAAGHYAQVVAVGPGGWLLITEMNFYWRGGGWQKVDYRFIHTGPGVVFRY